MSIPRGTTLAGRLASLGFADAGRAERLIAGELALDVLGADGDWSRRSRRRPTLTAALAGLGRLAPGGELLAALRAELACRPAGRGTRRERGADRSPGPAPGDWAELRGPSAVRAPEPGELRSRLLASAGADPAATEPAADLGSAGRQDRPSCASPTGEGCCGWPRGT